MGGPGSVSLNEYKNSGRILRGKSDKPTPYKGDSGARNINDAVTLSGTKKEGEGLASKAWKLLSRIVDFWSK